MACAIQDGLATLFQASMGCVPLARTETTETDRIFRVCGHAVRRPSRRLSPGPRSSAPSAGDVGRRACLQGKTIRENPPSGQSRPQLAPLPSRAHRQLPQASRLDQGLSGVHATTLSVAPTANTTLRETTMSTTCPCIAQRLITALGMASSL